ncbi:hypothetical protein V494_05117 [Pseudogymnoascus sp. VKM F-4513 (FW-928)]|nr:hypothetical protein V494_05117 [Pseudogymnoascus sp. VKM F-4513 (FW-928)]
MPARLWRRYILIRPRLSNISNDHLSPSPHPYLQHSVMDCGCNTRIIPNGNNTSPYGVHTGPLTAERAPAYNEANCSCAQSGTSFANGHIRAPLCTHNLQHLQQTMSAMNDNNSQYPLSWASSGTDVTAINVDEGCHDSNYVHYGYNNDANNTYLQMVSQDGLNEAFNLRRVSQAQEVLRFPIAIQRMISEMEQGSRPISDEYQEYEPRELVPERFDTNRGTFIALGPTHIIPPSDSLRVTRGYSSTRGESSVVSGPASGSGSGSGLWNKGESYLEHIGAQYELAEYDYDDAEET